jgi:hypothetical protein
MDRVMESWNRRAYGFAVWWLIGCMVVLPSGCATPWLRFPGSDSIAESDEESADTDGEEKEPTRSLEEILTGADAPKRIGDATEPFGMTFVKVESVALVNGLPGTGGAPQPSSQRDELLDELKAYDVERPNMVMDSRETAMVTTQVILPPGARKGDLLDIFVRLSDKSEATSIKGGWLMPTRLREMRVLGGSIRQSDVAALGRGPVLVHQQYSGSSDAGELRTGFVLGGAVATESRKLGLRIRANCKHVMISAKIAELINDRFYFFDGTRRRGIATAKEDDFIEIDVHPRYRNNVSRMMAVIRQLPIRPKSVEMSTRMEELEMRMNEPVSAEEATFELEALGESGGMILRKGLASPLPELRFYAAHALAYLDDPESIAPLEQLSAQEPAFRFHAIKALGGMDSMLAGDALMRLLHVPSIETRYAAFRALANRSDADLTVPGQSMVDGYRYYQIPSEAPPLIVLSGVKQPEVVTFGPPQALQPFDSLIVRQGLVIRTLPDGQLALSHFRVGHEDQRATSSGTIPGLLNGLMKVEASYGDAVEALRLCKQQSLVGAQVVIDPLPDPNAEYLRPEPTRPIVADEEALPPPNVAQPVEPPKYPWWDARRYWYE